MKMKMNTKTKNMLIEEYKNITLEDLANTSTGQARQRAIAKRFGLDSLREMDELVGQAKMPMINIVSYLNS